MGVFKCKETGTWYVMTRYRDWKGERKQKCKRGFATKRAAQDWEQKFHMQNAADMDSWLISVLLSLKSVSKSHE